MVCNAAEIIPERFPLPAFCRAGTPGRPYACRPRLNLCESHRAFAAGYREGIRVGDFPGLPRSVLLRKHRIVDLQPLSVEHSVSAGRRGHRTDKVPNLDCGLGEVELQLLLAYHAGVAGLALLWNARSSTLLELLKGAHDELSAHLGELIVKLRAGHGLRYLYLVPGVSCRRCQAPSPCTSW